MKPKNNKLSPSLSKKHVQSGLGFEHLAFGHLGGSGIFGFAPL